MVMLIFLIIFFYFFDKVFSLRNLYNPLVFIVIYHFVFFYVGLFYKDIYSHISISNTVVWLINYSFFGVFVGGILSRALFQKIGKSYYRIPLANYDMSFNNYNIVIAYFFLVIAILLTIKLNYSNGGIVFLMDDIENSRIKLREGKGLITQLIILFTTYGLLSAICYKRKSRLTTFLIVLVSLFLILTIGNRGPVLFLLLHVFLVYQVVYKKQFSYKYLAIIGFVLFLIMVALGSLRVNHSADFHLIFKFRFLWRPFVNIQNFQMVLDYFPDKNPFLLGETYLVDFKILFPGSNPNSGTFLKNLMNLDFDGGSLTPSYLGISYVNFGYYGLFFSPIFLGFIANSFYGIFVRNFNLSKPHLLILLIIISNNFAAVIVSGFMTVIIQNMSIILFVHVIYVIMVVLFKRTALSMIKK